MARRHNIETRLTATDKTKAAFNRVQKRMKSLKKASLVAGGGIAAMGAGFVVAAKRAVNFGDDIAKTAGQIGISTKAFQEMRLAADLAGVSEEKFGSGLAKLAKNVGEFREGTGTLVTFLDKLGDESFADLLRSTDDTEQAFKLFIKRMDEAANSQQKLALANAAFGRGVGQMLAGMSFKELEEGIAIAQKFGIAIDDTLLKEAERIKDAFTVATSVFRKEFFSGLLRAIKAVDIQQFARDMAQLAIAAFEAAQFFGRLIGVLEESKPKRIEALNKEIKLLTSNVNFAQMRVNRLISTDADKNQLNEANRNLRRYEAKLNVAQGALDKLTGFHRGPTLRVDDLRPRPRDKDDFFAEDAKATKVATLLDKLMAYKNGLAQTRAALSSLNATSFESVEAMDNEIQRLETEKGIRKFINELKIKGLSINDETVNALINEANAVDALNRKLAKKKELFAPGPIQEYIDRTKDLNTSLQEVAVRGADRLTDSLIGIMDGTQKAGEAFKSMARSIIQEMQRMIIKKMILDKVMGFIEGMLPGASTGAKPKPKAKGGPVGTGRPYIVGEKGPELLVPRRNGHIVPNHAMGGAVVNQTINIETGVSQTVRAEIMQLMPQINESTKNAILDARRRGGSFADGFA